MPAKKEESHNCKAECAELHKQLSGLKKEIAALKKELKSKSSSGADPRVTKLVEALKLSLIEATSKDERLANNRKYQELINSL